ncbi:DNA-directed RNA polymerase III subunit RPC8 [Nannochloropsis gaditana CCMP526]|uniref:DNA-directed RNA polymerase III subunit RPC8 n=1 Tax=Nannochloropsis gaditana (strain CCMP526) TaxID=1093141 RepID=UPI00029F7966|nr:DNA-directed RNA polymerase III subunit RPC8 [Nannochloropsis gaditana CCMP526]EKU21415.1 DNA-directed RNA polymerase III subunit RPC8 [Nannochloropsis gaditana CCMP526]|eukprot:XP_005854944.1 DNA-directed RNA polymerase III subunit RPC8 [Nannochloropsis gaditana CCMP526]
MTEEVDRKYANRIVMNVGLGVCLYDFVDIGDAYLYPSDGAAHHRVTFRLMVFRPFIGEVLVGRVKQCSENGIKISLGFFDDIFVPSYLLQTPSEFDPRENVWVWSYSSDEPGEPAVRYPMEVDEFIRFRVRSVNFTHTKYSGSGGSGAVGGLGNVATGPVGTVGNPVNPKVEVEGGGLGQVRRPRSDTLTGDESVGGPLPPMQLLGTTNEDGLGMLAWWG